MKFVRPNGVERDIQKMFIQTGLIDFIFGIYFISVSFIFDANQFIKMGVIFAIIIIYNFIKTKVIEPRIGICKFSIRRSQLFRVQNIIIASLTVLLVIVTILSNLDIIRINQNILSVSASLIVFLITLLLAKVYSFYRLAIYGLLISSVILFMNRLVDWVGEQMAEYIMFLIPGSLIIVYAIIKLMLFIKRNDLFRGDDFE